MRLMAVAFAVVLALAAPGTAAAGYVPPAATAALPAIQPVADAAWPESPCAEQLTIQAVPGLVEPSDYTDPLVYVAAGSSVSGLYSGGCVVQVGAALPPLRACDVAVHEAGHAAGLGHSTSGVMTPDGGSYGPCHHDPELLRLDRLWQAAHSWSPRACRTTTRGVQCIESYAGRSYLRSIYFHGEILWRETIRRISRRYLYRFLAATH